MINKRLLIGFIFVFFGYEFSCGISYAQKSTHKRNVRLAASHLAFDTHFQDLGILIRGEKKVVSFPFVNSGANDLMIQGVISPCGCTAVNIDTSKRYAPNENGMIEVTFDSSDFDGSFAKVLTVVTNEKQLPDRTLSLSGTVVSEFSVDPPLLDFEDVSAGHEVLKKVRILTRKNFKFQLERIVSDNPHLILTTSLENDQLWLNATLKPSAPIGFFREVIKLKNNSKNLPFLKIPVRANVVGPVTVAQAYSEFGAVSSKGHSSRPLTFLTDLKMKFSKYEVFVNGEKITPDPSFLSVNLQSADEKKAVFTTTLNNNGLYRGSVYGKLYFETVDAKQNVVASEFYAMFQ